MTRRTRKADPRIERIVTAIQRLLIGACHGEVNASIPVAAACETCEMNVGIVRRRLRAFERDVLREAAERGAVAFARANPLYQPHVARAIRAAIENRRKP